MSKQLVIGLCGIGCVAMLIGLGAYQFLFIQQTPDWGEAWLAEKCEDIGLSWNTTDNACEVEPVMSFYREDSKSNVGGQGNHTYEEQDSSDEAVPSYG